MAERRLITQAELGSGVDTGGGTVGGMLNQTFATGGTRNLINSLSAETAEERQEQLQAIINECAANGGYFATGICHTGQAAVDVATAQANSETASQELINRANSWLEANTDSDGNYSDTSTTDTGEDTSAISDENAIASVLATVPEQLKGIITADNVIKVLETGAQMNDPMTKIKKAMGAGVQFEWPGDWRNWKVFGPLAIPGVPLPPGIIDITIGEVIDSVGDIGGFIKDPLGKIGELGTTIKNTVEGVFGGSIADPGWGGTLGGFEDWVKGILGNVVGGAVLVDIYEDVKDVFTPDTTTTVVPGGADTDDDTTKKLKQGDDVADPLGSSTAVEKSDQDTTQTSIQGDDIADPFGSSTAIERPDDDDDDILSDTTKEVGVDGQGGFIYIDPNSSTIDDGGGSVTDIGGSGSVVTDTGGGGVTDVGGGGVTDTGGGGVTDIGGDGGSVTEIGGGGVIDVVGVDIDEDPDDPDEIGGTPKSSGGGGGGGGGGGMFDPQSISPPGMGDPALLSALQFPMENFLDSYQITKGLFEDFLA